MLGIPKETKTFGLLLATYAAADGTRIHPGEEVLARDAGVSERTVRTHLKRLREEYYLIERTSRGSDAGRRGGWSDEYRLVIPDDITDRVELVEPRPSRRRREAPAGVQPKLPIQPVDNQQNTGSPLPVDNPEDRKPTSGDKAETPEIQRRNTGSSASKDRKSSVERPEARFRSPIQGPIQGPEPTPEQPGSRPAQLQGQPPPVDIPTVENPAPPAASSDWATVIGRVRDQMAEAVKAHPRHARPNPEPITRPDRE